MIWVAGGLVAVLLVLSLTPLRLELALGSDVGSRKTARLTWAWGLIAADLAKQTPPLSARPPKAEGGQNRERARRPRLPTARMLADAITPLLTFLRRLVQATHPRDLQVQAQIGCEDPAETGMLWGVLGPAVAFLGGTTGHAIEVEPVFAGPELQWTARGRFTLIPAELLGVLLAFGLAPAVVRIALHMSRSYR